VINLILIHSKHLTYQIEDSRSWLVADVQQIPEAFRDHQGHHFAFTFKQGIGGNRSTHANPVDNWRIYWFSDVDVLTSLLQRTTEIQYHKDIYSARATVRMTVHSTVTN